jgi:hypothetical protein
LKALLLLGEWFLPHRLKSKDAFLSNQGVVATIAAALFIFLP